MNPKILNFLAQERVGAISVLLPNGAPHSAAVHYSLQKDPLKIYIQTSNNTKKVQGLLDGKTSKAAMVFGFSEEDWLTLQMDGNARLISDAEKLQSIYKIHYQKNPEAEKYKGANTVFIEFTPTWYRFTDFNTEPETVLEAKI